MGSFTVTQKYQVKNNENAIFCCKHHNPRKWETKLGDKSISGHWVPFNFFKKGSCGVRYTGLGYNKYIYLPQLKKYKDRVDHKQGSTVSMYFKIICLLLFILMMEGRKTS